MNNRLLLAELQARLLAGENVVWLGVARCQGSTPREPGAHMLLGRDFALGTIGGGHLELRALEIARAQLAAPPQPPRLERFPLGARVGQCCGGVVWLGFETVTPADLHWVAEANALAAADVPWLRLSALDRRQVEILPASAADRRPDLQPLLQALPKQTGDQALLADIGPALLLERFQPPELHLALFGAGHVGRALVQVLAPLPLQVSWIDPREDEFLPVLPANTRRLLSDDPLAEVAALPEDSAVLIMTHSHALDLELVRAWLARGDFRFLGLIGSAAKRASFEGRLRARGSSDAQLARLVCPVGAPGVGGKEPEVIAIAVAAQLLALRRQASSAAHKTRRVA